MGYIKAGARVGISAPAHREREELGGEQQLFRVDSRYHCCQGLASEDTAWNADYYGAMLHSYHDGTQTWLNSVTGNGSRYRAQKVRCKPNFVGL